MRSNHKTVLTGALAALAAAFFLARFLSIAQAYPYYFIWDMDVVDAIDVILIGSGLQPDHLNHPCFGMYLVQSLSTRLASGMGALSALSLRQLDGSLNPAACIAELTTFLRLHSPYLEILLMIFLWAAASLILRPGRGLALLFLVALGLQESFAFHSAMIRTELYAMVFWSAALLAVALAARARTPRGFYSGMAVSGAFLALCFLTKVQSALHLALFAPLALLSYSLCKPPSPQSAPQPKKPKPPNSSPPATPSTASTSSTSSTPSTPSTRAFLILSAINLAFFILLIAISWGAAIDPQLGGVFVEKDGGFGLNPFALAFLLGGAGLAGAQAWFFLKKIDNQPLFRLLCAATLLFSGFLAAFLLHFLVFANPATSLGYLRTVFKMTFLREIESQQKLPYIIVKPLGLIAYHPMLFVVHLALLATLAAGHFQKFIRLDRLQLACCAAASLVCLAMPWLTVRYFLRDFIWIEIPLTLLNFYYLVMIWRGARRFAPRLRAAALASFVLVAAVSTAHGWVMPRRLAMNNNVLGWNVDFWQKQVYKKNQPLYTQMMEHHYSWEEWKVARRSADRFAENRRAAEFVFQNLPVSLRQVGAVSEGFPVWSGKLDWRIAELTPDLRLASIVDTAALEPQSKYFAKNQYVKEHSEYMDKFAPAPGPGLLAILPRTDLQVLLFVQREDLAALTGSPDAPGPRITLRRGNETLALTGLEIQKYTELPVRQLTKDYFFVLQRKW